LSIQGRSGDPNSQLRTRSRSVVAVCRVELAAIIAGRSDRLNSNSAIGRQCNALAAKILGPREQETGRMPRFAANLSSLFAELTFPERFAAAARHGFSAVEYLFPYDYSKEELAELLKPHDLQQVMFNLPSGHWEAGERGLACDPHRIAEFKDGLELAI